MPIVAGDYGYPMTIKHFTQAYKWMGQAIGSAFHKDINGNYDRRDADGNLSITIILNEMADKLPVGSAERNKYQDLITMLEERKLDGTIGRTQVMDIIGVGKDGYLHSGALQEFSRKAAWMFHHSERINREVTLIGAFLAAREGNIELGNPSIDYDAANRYAKDTVEFGQGNYDTENAARMFRGAGMGVTLQYMKYPQMMMYLYARTAVDQFNGWKKMPETNAAEIAKKAAAKKESKAAARTMSGLVTMQFVMAGALGMPLMGSLAVAATVFGPIVSGGLVISGATLAVGGLKKAPIGMSLMVMLAAIGLAASGDDDDPPWDVEHETRAGLAELTNETFANTVLDGPATAWSPWNTAARSALSDLIFRPSFGEKEGRDAGLELLSRLGGPFGSILLNYFEGIKLYQHGQKEKALEMVAPNVIKYALKAQRIATHGYTTGNGNFIRDPDYAEILGQSIGVTSSKQAVFNEERSAYMSAEKYFKDTRAEIVHELVNGQIHGEAVSWERFNNWNLKHPADKISRVDVRRSLHAKRREISKSAAQGYAVSKKFPELYGLTGMTSVGEKQ